MNLSGRTTLTATAVGISLFLLQAGLVSAQRNRSSSRKESLNLGNNSCIRIKLMLTFTINCSNITNHGVRLEVELQSAASLDQTEWIPIKKYAPNPDGHTCFSNIDSAANNTLCPNVFKFNNTILIKECISMKYVQHFSETKKLQLRWIQEFQSRNEEVYATWILEDINIRIWSRGVVLQDLSAKLNRGIIDSYDVRCIERIGCNINNTCKTLELTATKTTENTSTNRSIIFNLADVSNLCVNEGLARVYDATECADVCQQQDGMNTTTGNNDMNSTTPKLGEKLTSILSGKGDLKKQLDDFINMYNGTQRQKIIDSLIGSAADYLNNKEADTKAIGRALELLDLMALMRKAGRVSTEIYTLTVRDFVSDEYKKSDIQLKMLQESEGAISLPGKLLSAFASNVTGIRVASFVFKNLSAIFPIDTVDNNTMLGSAVVSSTLGCMGRSCNSSNYTLINPVIIEIRHFSDLSDNVMPGCFFLDLEKFTWSSKGCNHSSTLSNSSFTVCECNHLTHFAILLSPGIEIVGKDKFALETISYLGVAFSVLCMIATIGILTFLKALRDMRTFIHVNLCICLIISQVVFVTAIDKTAIEELCQAIAIMLHYFWLTTFMWMLMEGVVLYVVLVRVFIKHQYRYMIGFTLASYGLPALYVFCVAVPLGFTIKDSQRRPQYGSSSVSDTCWLHYSKNFNWTFITPVIVIIIANIGFLIMAIGIMQKHRKRVIEKPLLKNASHWLKAVISLVVVMGITWIIGVLVFHKALTFVAYIFAITTGLQGSFIFLLFVVMSKQVRDHYRTWWRSKKGESKFLTNLFSFGTVGRSKNPKETLSNSYAVAKVRTLPTKTNDLDKVKAAATAELQLRNMQMVKSSEQTSNFEGSADIDYGSTPNFEGNTDTDFGSLPSFDVNKDIDFGRLQFINVQILDCGGNVLKSEGVTENLYVQQPSKIDPRSHPGKGTDQQPSSEDIGNCTIIENEMNSD